MRELFWIFIFSFPLAFLVIRIAENIFIDLKKRNISSNDTILQGDSEHKTELKLIFFFGQHRDWYKKEQAKNIQILFEKPYFFSLHKGRPAFVVCKALMSVVLSAVLLAFYGSKYGLIIKKNSSCH